MLAVRWWPHTGDARVASYRLRCRQIVDDLAKRGVDAGIFDPDSDLPPQVLVLSKRYDETSIALANRLRSQAGTRLLLDLCDNHFHVDNAEPRLLQRAESLRQAARAADTIVVSSEALAEVVQAEAQPTAPIVVIADACEAPFEPGVLERLQDLKSEWRLRTLAAALRRSGVPVERRLLWFGNHGSPGAEGGMSDLARIETALHDSHHTTPLSLTVISNDADKFARLTAAWRLPVHYLPWRAGTFTRAARLHSVALVPVGLNPFTRCKTNNRIATSLMHGLNIVADSIPSYAEFSDCAVLDDWQLGLGPYLADAKQRAADLARGQRLLAERYSLATVCARWQRTIDAAAPPGELA